MNQDPTIRNLIQGAAAALGVALLAALLFATNAGATQPECTGDRHYDGVACCLPPVECPTPDVCEPVLPCPDAPACPPVTCSATCEDGADGRSAPPVIVQVDRCPEAEVSELCKVRRNGTVVCPRSRAGKRGEPGPRKIFVPRSIIDKIADVERY